MNVVFDLLADLLLGITTSVQVANLPPPMTPAEVRAQVANLPPPMTPAEVRAQVLYTDDCKTTRRGIEMTCQQGFIDDLDNSK